MSKTQRGRSRRGGLGRLLVCVTAALSFSACENPFGLLYEFDRDLPAARGAIFADVVRGTAGGDPAPYAQVSLLGTGLVRQATDRGSLVVTDLGAGTYLMRVSDDEDGDGQPERSRLISTSLVVASKPEAFGVASSEQLVSVALGEVVVEGTSTVTGEVLVDDGNGQMVPPSTVGLVGRALLFRNINAGDSGLAFQLSADAETHVDDEGQYRFNKVLAGQASVSIVLHRIQGGQRGPSIYVSPPAPIALESGATVEAPPIEVDATDDNLEQQTRPLEVSVTPQLVERGTPYAIFVPPGSAVSTCQQTVPTASQFSYERIVTATAAPISRINDAPLGVWDVRLCGEVQFVDPDTGQVRDEIELATATLYNVVINPAEDGVSTILVGPAVLSRELDPCVRNVCGNGSLDCDADDRVLIRDCDGDALRGLPPFDATSETVVGVYNVCASVCGRQVGAAAATTTCEINGLVYDCDDDGDLQADTSEPPECLGPGLGDDRDGDGICTGADAFPSCSANTAEACEAGTNDVTPQIPEEFGGEGLVDRDGGVDLPDDGGTTFLPPDAGPVPDGGNPQLPVQDPSYGQGSAYLSGDANNEYDVVTAIDHESAGVTVIAIRRTTDGTFPLDGVHALGFNETGEFIADERLAPQTPDESMRFYAYATDGTRHYFSGDFNNDIDAVTGAIVCAYTAEGETLVPDVTFGADTDGCTRIPDQLPETFIASAMKVVVGAESPGVYLGGFGQANGSIEPTVIKFAKLESNGAFPAGIPNGVFDQSQDVALLDPNDAAGVDVVGIDVFDFAGPPARRVIVLSGTAVGGIHEQAVYAYAEVDAANVFTTGLQTFAPQGGGTTTVATGQVAQFGIDQGTVFVGGDGALNVADVTDVFLGEVTVLPEARGGVSATSRGLASNRDFATVKGGLISVDGGHYFLGGAEVQGVAFPEIWRLDVSEIVPLLGPMPALDTAGQLPVVQAVALDSGATGFGPRLFGVMTGGIEALMFRVRLNPGVFP